LLKIGDAGPMRAYSPVIDQTRGTQNVSARTNTADSSSGFGEPCNMLKRSIVGGGAENTKPANHYQRVNRTADISQSDVNSKAKARLGRDVVSID
jgi:hypothetical protein